MKLLSNKAEIVKCETSESIAASQQLYNLQDSFTSPKNFLQCHTSAIAHIEINTRTYCIKKEYLTLQAEAEHDLPS